MASFTLTLSASDGTVVDTWTFESEDDETADADFTYPLNGEQVVALGSEVNAELRKQDPGSYR